MTLRQSMRALCGRSPFLSKPFSRPVGGREYDCATNGHALLIVSGASYPRNERAPEVSTVIPEAWQKDFAAPFASVREWALAGGSYWQPCDICNGDRFSITCECCGRDGAECQSCDDDRGMVADKGEALFLGVYINRKLLGEYLRNLDADTVRICANGSGPIGVIAGEWAVYVMPIQPLKPLGNIPRFPPTDEIEAER